MARGRKPETAEQQALKGAPGKRMSQKTAQAIRSDAKPTPIVIGNVRPPKWLKRSRKATEIWNDLAPRLAKLNLVSELDALPLGRYCRYVVEWIAADLAVQKEGTWFDAVGTNGEATKKRHPAWQACQDIEKMLRETEAAFGMRPDTRYKIMRDQALSHGMLPLFDRDRDNQSEQASPAPAAAAPSPEDDALGYLSNFDSVPPGRAN
ncbi:phage terminase small subunit P27 family [Mesorhizobium sp.]|uniref:phage terminase small subunit P27 family n=1 Tax=Mesorhizobium sp. TaxID=1871066 RepID=UPI000FE6E487|nr:phage terminase small subunit P27 family [Mesorhizobium sp.]RWC28821.1 MAG: phage terminase small subunit P27 family [Mesorhizobium sp.]TIX28268.1 MAG: phage terminase small subunit P27 family [Mesorhizobium sp.]